MIQRINAGQLKDFCNRIFMKAGIPETDAKSISEVLVTTDMRGVASHGVVRAARYIDCIQAGGIQPAASPEILAENPSMVRLSACGGLGIPASMKAIRMVIERARKSPIVIGTVCHSDHFGAAGYYAMLCAEAGLIGYSMSNTIPLIAPTGGGAPGIGNNPYAYAAPAGKYRALLFDICMSVVASGKIEIASRENKKIPFGWILDSEGKPTDDPSQIYKGAVMLPFGDHKGYGLAAMVEMMTGVLGSAGILSEVKSWNMKPGRDSNTGHCFFAVNPEFFGGLELFRNRMDQMIEELINGRKAPGAERIYYPGEIEFAKEKDALENGVPLSPASMGELKRAASLVGLDFPF